MYVLNTVAVFNILCWFLKRSVVHTEEAENACYSSIYVMFVTWQLTELTTSIKSMIRGEIQK